MAATTADWDTTYNDLLKKVQVQQNVQYGQVWLKGTNQIHVWNLPFTNILIILF